jgi:hypothetical protein
MGAAALVAALTWIAAPAAAQEQNAGNPGEWLSRYTSARTLGMGGAYVATADDPLGVLWNPAGISTMDQNELRFENAHLFEETSINGFGFAVPGSWLPSFGVSMVSMGSGDFQRTNDMNDPLGTFKNGETAYLLTASKAFSPRLSIGTNFKFVQQTVEDFSAQGFGMDLGVLFDVTPTVRVGGSVANLAGPSLKLRDVAETYPVAFRGGVAAEMFNGRGLMSLELDQSTGLGAGFHAGAEYWLQPMIALRAGFDNYMAPAGSRTASRRSTSSTTRSPISRSVSRIAWASATAWRLLRQLQGGSGDLLADRREGGHQDLAQRADQGRARFVDARDRQQVGRGRAPLRGPGSAARARPVGRQGRDRHAAGRWHVPLPVDGQGPARVAA